MIEAHIGFLFNSLPFICIFLPISLVIYYSSLTKTWNFWILWGLSIFFYAMWDIKSIPFLLTSICFNYFIGKRLRFSSDKKILVFGVGINLAALIFTKYFNLMIFPILSKVLIYKGIKIETSHWFPIGISFFTFTQIGYLVDSYRSKLEHTTFLKYANFVTFFPHMVAGPILNHKNIMPQFEKEYLSKNNTKKYLNIKIGFEIFVIGMAKKVLIADKLAPFVSQVFDESNSYIQLREKGTVYLLLGMVSYSFQLYFDFSGYSEMAVGIAKMFGFDIPANFMKPYTATNLIDFWRRWHISLSDFLRDYLYIPLGGNKRPGLMRYRNLVLTMIIGGLWHGANWTFAVWGFVHGLGLCINHLYRRYRKSPQDPTGGVLSRVVLSTTTFTFVSLAWVLFRSPSLAFAADFYRGVFNPKFHSSPLIDNKWIGLILLSSTCVLLEKPLYVRIKKMSKVRTIFLAIAMVVLLFLLNQPSSYLYAQF